jgi:hypothetical protein
MLNTEVTPDEAALLLALVRPQDDAQRIRGLVLRIKKIDRLIELARKHGVLPLLCSQLCEVDIALPSELLSRLRYEYRTNLAQNLAAVSELVTLLADFTQSGISALPFKGVALAQSIYGKVGLRPAGDLDLLIHRKNVPRATEILIHHGYELQTVVQENGSPVDVQTYEYHFERPSDGMIVELRWRLTQPHFHADLGMDWLWPRRRSLTLLGAEVPAMSPEDTLIVLCLHGSKHGWSRLIWLRDVAQSLACHPDLDWNSTVRDAHRFGLSGTLALGVSLSVQIAGMQVPERTRRYLQRRPRMRKLAEHLNRNLFDDLKRVPIARVPYHAQLLGFRDRLRWRWGLRPWRPNQRDRHAMQFPPALNFLYYFLRPLRLARDYWQRDS